MPRVQSFTGDTNPPRTENKAGGPMAWPDAGQDKQRGGAWLSTSRSAVASTSSPLCHEEQAGAGVTYTQAAQTAVRD